MSLMVKNSNRGGICHIIYRYAKANNTYRKDYNKNGKSSYRKYWDVNNLYGCLSCLQIVFIIKISQKTTNEDSDEGYFLGNHIQYPENLNNPHNDSPFFPERMNIKKSEKTCSRLA